MDIGNSHVIAWYCWRELRKSAKLTRFLFESRHCRFASQDWSRYDGELL